MQSQQSTRRVGNGEEGYTVTVGMQRMKTVLFLFNKTQIPMATGSESNLDQIVTLTLNEPIILDQTGYLHDAKLFACSEDNMDIHVHR